MKKKFKGTERFCAALREIYDLNIEIAKDKNVSKSDREDARRTAEQARTDAGAHKCGWAERM